ncbi:MAG TPA: peptidylprolyl isomerase [Tepidisphaeraceae bacterium]|jgi:hypothetical protein|nr:peptidylprolyl isomerase [Tepidisphaeraceae bacterium]
MISRLLPIFLLFLLPACAPAPRAPQPTPANSAVHPAPTSPAPTFSEVHVRHILIATVRYDPASSTFKPFRTDAQAKTRATALYAFIVDGHHDFGAVAAAESDDAGTRPRHGDLGFFRRGVMVHEFEDAAFSLPIGQVSQPVKTPFGYHLIQVLERR